MSTTHKKLKRGGFGKKKRHTQMSRLTSRLPLIVPDALNNAPRTKRNIDCAQCESILQTHKDPLASERAARSSNFSTKALDLIIYLHGSFACLSLCAASLRLEFSKLCSKRILY